MFWTAAFWKAAAERAISTAAQVALVGWGTGTLPQVSLPWWSLPSMALAGGVLSLIKSLAASQIGNNGPSLTNSERLT
jgi:hypothetical protein